MKLKFEFETVEIDDDIIAVPVGDGAEDFHGVLKINESAKFILECLQQDTTEEAIVDKILTEFEGEREEITAFVSEYVGELRAAELLI